MAAQYADPELLKRVAQAKKRLIDDWAEGISIVARAQGRPLDDIRFRVVADRIELAAACRVRGNDRRVDRRVAAGLVDVVTATCDSSSEREDIKAATDRRGIAYDITR